jgi:hypothetical protein
MWVGWNMQNEINDVFTLSFFPHSDFFLY